MNCLIRSVAPILCLSLLTLAGCGKGAPRTAGRTSSNSAETAKSDPTAKYDTVVDRAIGEPGWYEPTNVPGRNLGEEANSAPGGGSSGGDSFIPVGVDPVPVADPVPVPVPVPAIPVAACPTPESLLDDDRDGWPNCLDNCLSIANANQLDFDHDGIGDACDNCPDDKNANQLDTDNDGIGNVCDNCEGETRDRDSDSVPDSCDNCPKVSIDILSGMNAGRFLALRS